MEAKSPARSVQLDLPTNSSLSHIFFQVCKEELSQVILTSVLTVNVVKSCTSEDPFATCTSSTRFFVFTILYHNTFELKSKMWSCLYVTDERKSVDATSSSVPATSSCFVVSVSATMDPLKLLCRLWDRLFKPQSLSPHRGIDPCSSVSLSTHKFESKEGK